MSAFFINPASKFERAVRALLIFQGKASWDSTYIGNESVDRIVPNRTIFCTQVVPTKPYRPEGMAMCEIHHTVGAILQPGQTNPQNRVAMDELMGETMDTLLLGGDNNQAMVALADAITAAGRWLGTNPQPGYTTADTDMVNFRCDWVKFGSPSITRGKDIENNWVEVIHIIGQVSNAST